VSAIEIPGYKIIKTLGVGGQATVYLAIQQGFDREVALKIMSPALAADPSFGDRFLREAKIVAKLSHARIVTVYDVGESGSFYYLAMEYMRGEELKSRIANGLKTKEALVIIARLAEALHFAHSKGYIHRDVKSENILFDEDNQPVLTDFGIAKASNSSTQMTQTGKLIGTPEYMSPEQCRGRKLDGRADLYSLGIILFEMLTRRVPFTGEDSVSVCIQHVTKPVPQLPARLSHLQWLIDSLLAKHPSGRFQTGKELAESIRLFMKDGQQVAKTDSQRKDANITSVDLDIPEDGFEEQSFELNDDFDIDRRIEVVPESSSNVPRIVVLFFLLITMGLGYQFRTFWIPQTQQLLGVKWFDSKELSPAELIKNDTSKDGKKSDRNKPKVSKTDTSEAIKEATDSPTKNIKEVTPAGGNGIRHENEIRKTSLSEPPSNQVDALILKAETLARYSPHELSDIKQALDNLTTAKSISPDDGKISIVKQNIIEIALLESEKFSLQNKFDITQQWLELVESADHFNSDLAATKARVETRRMIFDQRATERQDVENRYRRLIADASSAIEQNKLSAPAKRNALHFIQQANSIKAKSPEVLTLTARVEEKYVSLIEAMIETNEFAKAKRYMTTLRQIPNVSGEYAELSSKARNAKVVFDKVEMKKKRLQVIKTEKKRRAKQRSDKLADPLIQMQLQSKLQAASDYMARGDLVKPIGSNALEKYKAALEIDPLDQNALDGVKKIESSIVTNLEVALSNRLPKVARNWAEMLKLFNANDSRLTSFMRQLEKLEVAVALEQEAKESSVNEGESFIEAVQPDEAIPKTNAERNSQSESQLKLKTETETELGSDSDKIPNNNN